MPSVTASAKTQVGMRGAAVGLASDLLIAAERSRHELNGRDRLLLRHEVDLPNGI
jgi:hypothetical protein